MKIYKCLSKNSYEYGDYSLISLREQDIYKIKDWRNSQIDVLRQKELLTNISQKKYFNEIIKPSFSEQFPNQILFSFLYKNECIGYGGFVHISWEDKRAEISFLIDNERAKTEAIYQQDFTIYLKIIKNIAFTCLDFNRVFVETYDIRKEHVGVIEASGFLLEGRMRQHVIINNKKADLLIHGFLKQYHNEK